MGDRKNIRIGEKRNRIEECEDAKEKEKRRYEMERSWNWCYTSKGPLIKEMGANGQILGYKPAQFSGKVV